jgi:hypothetical protein
MSWSISRTASKEKVLAVLAEDFDKAAAQYAGKEEEKDVLAVKDRAIAAVNDLKLDTDWANAVKVEASGSRSDGWSANLTLSVQRIHLDI